MFPDGRGNVLVDKVALLAYEEAYKAWETSNTAEDSLCGCLH
jgi:hypothetical protein